MNKVELIATVAEKENITKVESEKIVNAVLDTIVETVANDEKVSITGFGVFNCVQRAEREWRDPRSNTPITIAAKKAPKFKPSKNFKELLNK